MSASTIDAPRSGVSTTTTDRTRSVPAPTPFNRILKVELRKMFDTRSGFWLMMSIGTLSIVATVAFILFASEDQITYESFATAIGFPMSVILPMIAILGITSEWSQRNGLTTFTLVPDRGRVLRAKALATLVIGLGSMGVAFAIGALGNVVGSAIVGVDTVWNIAAADAAQVVLGNLAGMAIGFTLGVVLRSSSAAIVGYFVVSLVLPGIFALLAQAREWFMEAQPWIDWNHTQVNLFEGATDTAKEWAMLGSTTAIWIVLPLTLGVFFLRRYEVK